MHIIAAIGFGCAVSLVTASAHAQPKADPSLGPLTMMPPSYQLLCQPDVASGLDWKGADWRVAQFRGQTLIVQVGTPNVCLPPPSMEKFHNIGPMLATQDVCVNVRMVGQPHLKYVSGVCAEFYSSRSGAWEISLYCRNDHDIMAAAINGSYHRAFIHEDFSEEREKDSMFVEVGKCSILPR